MTQPELPLESWDKPMSDKDKAFWKFHKLNPHVYKELVAMTWKAYHAGLKPIGIKMFYETLRWKYSLKTKTKDYKLPNNHVPRYARLIMDNIPELQGMFVTHRLKG